MGYVAEAARQVPGPVPRPARAAAVETFTRKADAERFLREMEVDIARGVWIDPRKADMPLARWAEEFLAWPVGFAPTQDTYRRDLDKYILPRFGTTGSAGSRPTRSRTGSTMRSDAGWRIAQCIAITAPCAEFCRWPWTSRRSSATRAIGSSLRACRGGR